MSAIKFLAWWTWLGALLGRARWLAILAILGALAYAPMKFYLDGRIASVRAEGQQLREDLLARSKARELASLQKKRVAVQDTRSGGDAGEQFTRSLPEAKRLRSAPLSRQLSESRLRSLELKQVEYAWAASPGSIPDALRVGRLDANIQLAGDYPALRKWLAEVMQESPHLQLSALQVQRVSRDAASVTATLTLSVYFKEGT